MKVRAALTIAVLLLVLLPLSSHSQEKQSIPKRPAKVLVWKPNESFAHYYYSDGPVIRYIEDKGLLVAAVGYDEGDHLSCEVTVLNNTSDRLDILPELFFLTFMQDGKLSYGQPIPPQKIASKYLSRVKWGNFFRAVVAGMATTTSRSYESGTVTAIGPSGTTRGTYEGTITTTSPDTNAQRNAALANKRATEKAQSQADAVMLDALRDNTVFPTGHVSGLVHFKRKKADLAMLYVVIGETGYAFPFSGKK